MCIRRVCLSVMRECLCVSSACVCVCVMKVCVCVSLCVMRVCVYLKIPIEDDASWKERHNKKMEELKNTQFSGQDAVSDPGLLHKELVGEKTILISELYKAVDEKGNVDNFVDVLEQECRQRKLNLSDIFEQVTETGDTLLMWQQLRGEKRL